MECEKNGGNKDRIEYVLRDCEAREHHLHKRLSFILEELWNIAEVNTEVLSEIEDIYIKKGIIYCNHSYNVGYNDALKK
jgi:hypothetical protein